jgi:hypothetical protein
MKLAFFYKGPCIVHVFIMMTHGWNIISSKAMQRYYLRNACAGVMLGTGAFWRA